MISKNNKNEECNNVPIDEWEPEQWSDCRKEIEEYQNMLDDCGAASLIYEMFKEKNL